MSQQDSVSEPTGRRLAGLGARGPVVIALLSLGWLAAVLWLARGTVAAGGGSLSVSAAALVLPSVVTASLVAGAAAGLLGVSLWRSRRSAGRGMRAAVGAAGGLLAGLLAGGLIIAAYGAGGSILVVAGTVAGAGLSGGLVAALAPAGPVAAGLAGTLGTVAAGFLLEAARPVLKRLFGAGGTVASQVDATNRLTYVFSLVVAVVAGIAAFWYLHRARPAARWPGYLLAGACPGLLLLVAEGLTTTGGGRLLGVARALSPADRVSVDYLAAARVNHALIVLFAGAITAIFLHGRTLPGPDRERAAAVPPAPAGDHPAPAAGDPADADRGQDGGAGWDDEPEPVARDRRASA